MPDFFEEDNSPPVEDSSWAEELLLDVVGISSMKLRRKYDGGVDIDVFLEITAEDGAVYLIAADSLLGSGIKGVGPRLATS